MQRKKIIKTALKEVENKTKYIHQGIQLGKALDCAGLLYAVFLKNGFCFEYDHTLIEAENGSIINKIESLLNPTINPKPGDIATFKKNGEVFHLGIYLNDNDGGTFIHTNSISNCVVQESRSQAKLWDRYFYSYYSIETILRLKSV
jgi:cell wall-associated NlpC family hydrolase